jgi:transposase-like protein
MPRHIPQERKDEILLAIKNGTSVHEASVQFGPSVKTIYAWLRGQTDNTGTSSLEIARLRRENAELKEIIGWFTLKEKRGEKNQGR